MRMHSCADRCFALFALPLALAACGGGTSDTPAPVDPDYSSLRVAESREGTLVHASSDEQVLAPLRNGLRLSLIGADLDMVLPGVTTPLLDDQGSFSRTTVQIEEVDEADLVKYDGQHIYIVRPVPVRPSLTVPGGGESRNVLKIVRTDPGSAGVDVLSEFEIEGQQSALPLVYLLGTGAGATEYLAAVSQNFVGWLTTQPLASALVVQPDRTTIQLLDVRDPLQVAQVWKIELDGWLRGSRLIGDVLYVVSSYRPRLPDIILPDDTIEKRAANEQRIRRLTTRDLLPRYRENGGAGRQLVTPGDCVIATDLQAHEGFTDLLVITALSLSERRVLDVNCLSTNVNGVHVSRRSLYVGGLGFRHEDGDAPFTVLHKFALDGGYIRYRASGAVAGLIGWNNPSYFMDELHDDLRIVTTQYVPSSGEDRHQLSVLRETIEQRLVLLSTLPNAGRPARIGKPGEQLHAVRFFGDRAYVVTARIVDPLHVIDLGDPTDPFIAGELEIPGVATYLRPLGPPEGQVLVSVGLQTDTNGLRQGVKVELFDVRDIGEPRSLGVEVFGETGSWSEAVFDPHALTFLEMPGDAPRHRFALPITIFASEQVDDASLFVWKYSGLHLFEIEGIGSDSPSLRFQGVIKTEEPGSTNPYPSFALPDRSVLHDDSVFAIYGDRIVPSLWGDIQGL